MPHICSDEPVLLFRSGVGVCIAGVRRGRVVVVVAPFCEVVCEFESWRVGGGVFEIDHYELFVGVGREK